MQKGDQNEKKTVRKLKPVQRTYHYREQIGIALAMMGFIALIFTTMQNMNP